MDDRVRELLEQVRSTAVTVGEAAGATARRAAKYAGQTVDVAKLNMKIFDLKTDINALLREIGQVVYDTHLGADPGRDVESLLREVDEKYAAISDLKERSATLRCAKECPACGAACGKDDKFCKSCGKAF